MWVLWVTKSSLYHHRSTFSTLSPSTHQSMQYGSNLTAFSSLTSTPFTRSRTLINCISVGPCERSPSAQLATLQTFLSTADQPLQLGCTAITGSWWDCSWPSSLTKAITTGGSFLLWRLYRWPGKCHFSSQGQFSENEESCYIQLKHSGSPLYTSISSHGVTRKRHPLVHGAREARWWEVERADNTDYSTRTQQPHSHALQMALIKQGSPREGVIVPSTAAVLPHAGAGASPCSPTG